MGTNKNIRYIMLQKQKSIELRNAHKKLPNHLTTGVTLYGIKETGKTK